MLALLLLLMCICIYGHVLNEIYACNSVFTRFWLIGFAIFAMGRVGSVLYIYHSDMLYHLVLLAWHLRILSGHAHKSHLVNIPYSYVECFDS